MIDAGIQGVTQIAYTVSDLPRAVAFYRDLLDLRFLFEAGPSLAFLDCGGVRLMLSAQPGESSSSHPIVYFRVADIDASVAALRASGARIRSEPHVVARLGAHDLWLAFTEDPDGHPVGLMCERVPSADPSH
jgi:methylmalonyl-CoA/ethylmalonyl-CoA epimerase